jgi:hypothetical protein
MDRQTVCLGLGEQLVVDLQHCRRDIRVVVNHLPFPGFPAINVRNATIDGRLFSSKRKRPSLDPDFVCQVSHNPDKLIIQLDPTL